MKKGLLICLVALLALSAEGQDYRFGFPRKDYDNFSNLDSSAAFEIVVFAPNNDTLTFPIGASVSNIDGSAVNGIHYSFTTQNMLFPKGTTIYNGSNRRKFKINPVPDSHYWGTRYFYIRLTNLIGVIDANLINNQNQLVVIIDYDGSAIGLPKLSVHDYRLFPVPATDKLFIDGVSAKEFKIYDLSGRLVQEGSTIENTIDVSTLTTGLYVLKSITEQGLLVQKFVKQ